MLRAACDDPKVNERLERVLSMPDSKRKTLVRSWVNDMLVAEASKGLVQAIACLLDDGVGERAYEVIVRCRRGEAI
jgi:hypothetical protein